MMKDILNSIRDLNETEDSITVKLTDNRFLFIEIYAPVDDEEKFIAFELNSGYEEDGKYVLVDIIDNSVIDYGEWNNIKDEVTSVIEYYMNLTACVNV